MAECPLCGEKTFVDHGNGRRCCYHAKCGWQEPPGSCADIGGDEGVEKLYPYMSESAVKRAEKYKKLKDEWNLKHGRPKD